MGNTDKLKDQIVKNITIQAQVMNKITEVEGEVIIVKKQMAVIISSLDIMGDMAKDIEVLEKRVDELEDEVSMKDE